MMMVIIRCLFSSYFIIFYIIFSRKKKITLARHRIKRTKATQALLTSETLLSGISRHVKPREIRRDRRIYIKGVLLIDRSSPFKLRDLFKLWSVAAVSVAACSKSRHGVAGLKGHGAAGSRSSNYECAIEVGTPTGGTAEGWKKRDVGLELLWWKTAENINK